MTRIYVGGVSFSMSNDGLRQLFAEVGVVESAALATDMGTGHSRGYGFVEMASAEAALSAGSLCIRMKVAAVIGHEASPGWSVRIT